MDLAPFLPISIQNLYILCGFLHHVPFLHLSVNLFVGGGGRVNVQYRPCLFLTFGLNRYWIFWSLRSKLRNSQILAQKGGKVHAEL